MRKHVAITEEYPELEHAAELKEWFAGSKVVDQLGRPRVLFHGTTARAFESFSASDFFGAGMFGRGVNLTSSADDAAKYATVDLMINHDLGPKAEVMARELTRENGGEAFSRAYRECKAELAAGGGHVVPTIVAMKRPMYISDTRHHVSESMFLLAAAEADITREEAGRLFRRFSEAADGSQQFDVIARARATTLYRRLASLQNCDGLIITPEFAPKGNGATHYLAFDPEQVRSAILERPYFEAAFGCRDEKAIENATAARRFVDAHAAPKQHVARPGPSF